jgi:hypothetical protein
MQSWYTLELEACLELIHWCRPLESDRSVSGVVSGSRDHAQTVQKQSCGHGYLQWNPKPEEHWINDECSSDSSYAEKSRKGKDHESRE